MWAAAGRRCPKPQARRAIQPQDKKNCCGNAAVTPVALARRPRLPAATRQPPLAALKFKVQNSKFKIIDPFLNFEF
ncbi:hypothetical protein DP117_34120 [Brasilonema sp. UFV-L1]|nr:hypothetical protein [Brasilonema sp. UFV-L1]